MPRAATVLSLLALACASHPGEPGSELLLQDLPLGYEVGFQTRAANQQIVEMVPRGESVESWSEMLTTQIFFGGLQATPETFFDTVSSVWRANCPSGGAKFLQGGEENGYRFGFWALACPEHPATGKPEYTFFKAIQGRDSFYVVQKAWRSVPTREQVEQWTAYLRRVGVCDTRRPSENPCPDDVDAR